MTGEQTIAPENPIARQLAVVWSRRPGFWGFLADVNHGSIGLRFMVTAAIYFLIGGLLAMLMRVQLADPKAPFVGPDIYNQLFTMHGSIMMFLFAIPMLEGLALYLLPKMLGARDMAFPRLSALGWYCYFFGGLILLGALALGVAPDGGWFMYVPLADRTHTPGINADVWLLGITFVEISAICAAVEITVSILKVRAQGMSLLKMPLFAWYMLGTAAMMLIGFPPLIAGSILLEVQRAFDWPFFDVARGGDPVLWQHLFWLFGHPEVYIIFLPAAGALATIIATFARRPMIGYPMILVAIGAMVVLSMGLWVHHMFTIGIPHLALAFFSGASMMVAVPTAIQIFAWIGTLWAGTPRWSLPMLYVTGFFLTFVFGGLTGVMLAAVPFNWQAHDTAFVTAHLHYVLIGGFVFPMLAAITYWLPHISGRRAIRGLGKAAFWLIFIGTHGTFLVMHLTGLLGMPRRVSTYPDNPEWLALNLISSLGGFVMAAGIALFAVDVGYQLVFGRRTRANPWRAATLEWAMPLPPPPHNFTALPILMPSDSGDYRKPHEIDLLGRHLANGEGLLADASRSQRETLVVDMVDGTAQSVAVLPGNTLRPLWTALAIGLFFALMLAGLYLATIPVMIVIAVIAVSWAGTDGARSSHDVIPLGDGRNLLASDHSDQSLGRLGSAILLIANGALFASLLFGAVYLAIIAPGWPASGEMVGAEPTFMARSLGGGLTLLGGLALFAALRAGANRQGGAAVRYSALILVAVAVPVLAGLAGHVWSMGGAPQIHASFAVQTILACYVAGHFAICMLVLLGVRRAGATASGLAVLRQWLSYCAATTAITGLALLAGRL